MNYEERFISIWNRIEDLQIPEEAEGTICFYALAFQNWADNLLKILENPDVVQINQAKILLLDKFFEWHRFVPQLHKRVGIHGHTCIFQVFEKAYESLRVVELSLTPPLLFLPSTQQPKSPIIGGIFLGEDADEPKEN